MTNWLTHPAVHPADGGTYVLADERGRVHRNCWKIRPWPDNIGWRATSHDDGFGATRFATAADAIGAVLGDPAESHVVGGRLWTHADTGFPPPGRGF